MSKSKTDSSQGGPDQGKEQEHITKAKNFCQAAEFDEALKEIGKDEANIKISRIKSKRLP